MISFKVYYPVQTGFAKEDIRIYSRLEIYGAADERSEINKNIRVYNDDTLFELKRKLQFITGIPVYRQFLTIHDSLSQIIQTHSLYIDRKSYATNILADIKNKTSTISSIPIDEYLFNRYSDSTNIRVVPNDSHVFVEVSKDNFITNVVVHDLKQLVIDNIKQTLDKQEIDMIYYGFVIKYWPIVSYLLFLDIITGNQMKRNWYLKPDIRDIYVKKVETTDSIPSERFVSRIQLTGRSMNIKTQIELRNLFDLLSTEPDMPLVIANFSGKTLYKRYALSMPKHISKISIQRLSEQWDTNMVSIYSHKEFPIFITIHRNGTVRIEAAFNDRQNIRLESAKSLIIKKCHGIFESIRKFGDKILVSGSAATPDSLEIASAGIVSYLKIAITAKDFYNLKQHGLSELYAAKYAQPYKYQIPDISCYLYFSHGLKPKPFPVYDKLAPRTSSADLSNIENYYGYATNSIAQYKWSSYFTGRFVKITNLHNAVKIETHVFTNHEANVILKHIVPVIRKYESSGAKTLDRLIDVDPELFDLKKHSKKSPVYVRLCQTGRRPVIVRKPGENTVELKNYTTGQTEIYKCPYAKYPYVQTRIGAHPLGYPLPCCYKFPTVDTTGKSTEYIRQYGKTIPAGKLGMLPHVFQVIREKYRIYGAEQYTGNNDATGFANSFSAIFGKNAIKDTKDRDLIDSFVKDTPLSKYSGSPAIIEFVHHAMKIYGTRISLVYEVSEAEFEVANYIRTRTGKSAVVIRNLKNEYYPIVAVDGTMIFDDKSDIMAIISKKSESPVLTGIVRYYVNKKGLAYACDIERGSKEYSISIPTTVPEPGIKIETGQRDFSKLPPLNTLLSIIGDPVPDFVLISDKKQIGFGTDDVVYLHKPSEIKYPGIPVMRSDYDIPEIENEIHLYSPSPRVEPDESKFIEYRLLKKMFLSMLSSGKPSETRIKIIDSIKRCNFVLKSHVDKFYTEIKQILTNYPDDTRSLIVVADNIISSGVSDRGEQMLKIIENSKFRFDFEICDRVARVNRTEGRLILQEYLRSVIVKGQVEHSDNILSACASDSSPYCQGKKLILSDPDKLIDLLLSDIRDRFSILEGSLSNFIHEDIYIRRAHEKIKILV